MVSTIFQAPRSGQNNVAEYMSSGLPFATSSNSSATPYEIHFPFLTSEIYIHCSGSGTPAIRVGFTSNGVKGTNYFTVDATGNGFHGPFRIRCKSLFIMTHTGTPAYSVTAGLTGIPSTHFATLTGSAGDPVTGMPLYITGSYANEYGYAGIG